MCTGWAGHSNLGTRGQRTAAALPITLWQNKGVGEIDGVSAVPKEVPTKAFKQRAHAHRSGEKSRHLAANPLCFRCCIFSSRASLPWNWLGGRSDARNHPITRFGLARNPRAAKQREVPRTYRLYHHTTLLSLFYTLTTHRSLLRTPSPPRLPSQVRLEPLDLRHHLRPVLLAFPSAIPPPFSPIHRALSWPPGRSPFTWAPTFHRGGVATFTHSTRCFC